MEPDYKELCKQQAEQITDFKTRYADMVVEKDAKIRQQAEQIRQLSEEIGRLKEDNNICLTIIQSNTKMYDEYRARLEAAQPQKGGDENNMP